MSADGILFKKLHHGEQAIPSRVHSLISALIADYRNKKQTTSSFKARHCFNLSTRAHLVVSIETLPAQGQADTTPWVLITLEEASWRGETINESRLIQDYGFTKREIEIVHLIFKGLKNSEIAKVLFITEGTVKNHVKNIYNKIGVTTRTSLIHDILHY